MNCFPCFNRNKDSGGSSGINEQPPAGSPASAPDSSVKIFNFRELAMATKNFRQECILGEGSFGRVFKGTLHGSGQVVAVKQLDRNGMQGNKEFSTEVMTLSLLKNQNLVNLIGYCADGDQRVLVYEYMPLRSVENHLFGEGPEKKPLDWSTRMKIASGAAQGLQYLHEQVNPPVIYGDFKPSNVLLNEEFEPKLSDVGLSKLGSDSMNQPSSRVMDTFGYSAPEYTRGGEITLKSDVYCFGIVLLELITGRRAIDTTRPTDEQNLVTWAQAFFRDPKRFPEMADPRLNKQFPATALNQAVGIAAMCLQDEPMVRPFISDVTSVLNCISMIPNDQPQTIAPPKQQMEYENKVQENSSESHTAGSSESEDYEGESAEHSAHSSQTSEGESQSGSNEEESDDLSDEDSDEESSGSDDRRNSKNGRSRTKSSKRKQGTSRQTVVTFRVPSMNSRYSGSGKSEIKEDSSRTSSSEDSSSESEHIQRNKSTEIGSSSSHPEMPKLKGIIKNVAPMENRGRFNRSHTEPAQLRNLEITHA